MKNTFVGVLALAFAVPGANAAVIYDNFASTQLEIGQTNYGFSAIFRSDIDQTITAIDALLRINDPGRLAFHVFSLGPSSGPPVANLSPVLTTVQYFDQDTAMAYRNSGPILFGLLAGQWYAVAVGGENSITFSADYSTVVDPGTGFTSLANQNYNVYSAFTAPLLNGGGTGCCNIHYRLHGSTSVPEPGTLALLGLGLAGLGLSRRRRAN